MSRLRGHALTTDWDHANDLIRASCECGHWTGQRKLRRGPVGRLTREHARHVETARVGEAHGAAIVGEREWHALTGHCGSCGQPDGYCTCQGRCGCTDLHPAGEYDPLARYAVTTDQEAKLW